MKIIYDVEETPCYPCTWYGGPYWNGRRMSTATPYYFRTELEALANAVRLSE